jgi:hypothetical protein
MNKKSIYIVHVKLTQDKPFKVVGVFGTKSKAAQCQSKINSGALGQVFYAMVTVHPFNELHYNLGSL